MTVLDIVRAVCANIGIQTPNSLIGSTDNGVNQLRSLLNKAGSGIASRSNIGWQALIKEATFVTVADEDQGAVSTIIGAANSFRHIVGETMWNRTTAEPIFGSSDARMWQGFKAFNFTGPHPEFRIRNNRLLLLPAPSAGQNVYFEYASRNWLISADGTATRSSIVSDGDIPLIDEEILQLSLEWRWLKSKGLDYAEDFQEYERRIVDALANDVPQKRKQISQISDDGIPTAIPRLIGS